MIVDELILKLKADLSDVEKRLKEVEGKASAAGKNAGAEMGKTMGTSFGDVFNAIAGAAVLNTVKNFYSRAATEFNKFEASFLRVDSIAKGFGRSVDVARKNVDELAQKGFLDLNQAASSYADAIALGFDEKQARKFIDALSDVAAFQNTIGSGSAAVASGVSGLLSNSAEKVENIGVPIKVLNMAYNENIKTMGKAAALQKFYAGVLKESEKFSGDAARAVDTLAGAQNKANAATDKAMVAIGKGLEPILKKFYNVIEDLASGFAKWFGALNEGTKSIILVGAALVAIIPAFSAISAVLAALSINPVVLLVTAVVAAGVAIAAVTNQLRDASPKEIVKSYKDAAKELEELGERTKALESINKRTIAQELELISNKEKLRERARALGLDYDALALKANNYADVLNKIRNAEREQAAAKIDKERLNISQSAAANEMLIKAAEERYGKNALDIIKSGGETVSTRFGSVNVREALQQRESYAARAKMSDLSRAELYAEDNTAASKKVEAALAKSGAVEQRFLESSNKIAEIEKNRLFTIAAAKRVKDDEERKRQIDAANEDARLQVEAEFTARRQAYAEFIEDKYMADTEALKKSTDDAIRASNELLEAELKKAKDDEWAIAALKEDNEERLQEIKEADARKQAQITLQSFADTANAANATTTAAAALGRSKDAGGGISGLGGVASGIAGFKNLAPALGALGPAGQILGAAGGMISTITGLFGKSDEERAREAEQQRRRDEETKAILELQAAYQKSMLAIQEANAKLPFENLQRSLRLIDINAQQSKLSGINETQVETTRLQQRREAINSVLSSQAGAIGEGKLYSGTGSTAPQLIQFLSDRAADSVYIAQFTNLAQQLGAQELSGGFVAAVINQMQFYKGKIPDAMYNAVFAQVEKLKQQFSLSGGGLNSGTTVKTIGADLFGIASAANTYSSESSKDVGIAENLLSTIEQSLQVESEINANTKKTADNTAKALELRPDRERSFIDVGQGFIQSLGQRITSPSAIGIARSVSQNLTIPTELGAANVITGRARTLQERMADALETQIRQGATANDILRDIRAAAVELLTVMDGNPGTVSGMSMNDFVSLQSEANRRRV